MIKQDKIDRDKGAFNNSYHLSEAISSVMRGDRLDERGRDKLIEEMGKSTLSGDIIENLSSEEYVKSRVLSAREAYSERNREKLLDKIRREKRKSEERRSRLLALSGAIASVAAILIISLYIYSDFKNVDNVIYVAESAPESKIYNEPVLVVGEKTVEINQIEKETGLKMIDKSLDYKTQKDSNRVMTHTMVVPAGYTQSVILSDGSEVIINSQSSLTYPTEFVNDSREVILKGEAYFKVAKGERPFVVKVNDLEARVYGTEFNINEYNGNIETVLVKGSLGVASKDKEIMLKPNQRLLADNRLKDSKLSDVNAAEFTGWMSDYFDYRSRPLPEILRDITRWYDVEIEITEELKNYNLSLFSPRDVSINDIFKLINMSNDVIFINEGKGKYKIKR